MKQDGKDDFLRKNSKIMQRYIEEHEKALEELDNLPEPERTEKKQQLKRLEERMQSENNVTFLD